MWIISTDLTAERHGRSVVEQPSRAGCTSFSGPRTTSAPLSAPSPFDVVAAQTAAAIGTGRFGRARCGHCGWRRRPRLRLRQARARRRQTRASPPSAPGRRTRRYRRIPRLPTRDPSDDGCTARSAPARRSAGRAPPRSHVRELRVDRVRQDDPLRCHEEHRVVLIVLRSKQTRSRSSIDAARRRSWASAPPAASARMPARAKTK